MFRLNLGLKPHSGRPQRPIQLPPRQLTQPNPSNNTTTITSYSQLNQDLEVLKLYNNKSNGFFVDIGASDGIELSNTYLLETMYNWKGICVEPIPMKFYSLCRNRLHSRCYRDTVYSESDKQITIDSCNSATLLSDISDNVNDHKDAVNQPNTQITVNTITLTYLLDVTNSPTFIEYLSLDTEGSELEILKSVDFQKYTFGAIDVEHNYVEPRRTEIRNLLTANNYHYVRENKFDDHYQHNSIYKSESDE